MRAGKKLQSISFFYQLITYGCIGFFCALIDFCIFKMLVTLEYSISISNCFSITSALLISYTLNSKFTFKVDFKNLSNFLRYTLFGIITILFSTWLVTSLVTDLIFSPGFAKAISILPAALLQFSLNRFLNYK